MSIKNIIYKIKSVYSANSKLQPITFILLYLSAFLIPTKIVPRGLLIIYTILYYLGTMVFAELILFRDRKKCFTYFKAKYKTSIIFLIIESFVLITITVFFSCYSSILLGRASNNENEIRQLPMMLHFLLSVVYAPVVEECLFRYVLRYLIKNKILFVNSSALIFGFFHTISSIKSFSSEELAVLSSPYVIVGMYLSLAYLVTNNIELVILNHRTLNLIACIPVIIQIF